MKILVVCQHYYPEPFRISDICESLVKMGNEVTVVTGLPNYPEGEIYPGYKAKECRDEVVNGVKVHRCPIHPRKKGAIHRVWNYFSFSHASKKYIKKLDDSFDVVFVNQLSPVMMANAGIKYAKRYNKKVVLYCLDLWPASLRAGGIDKGFVYKWFTKISRKIYTSVDKILVSSETFSKYFYDEFGIEKTIYLPQYAEDSFTMSDCMKTPNGDIDLMFAGNIGMMQSVETIIKASVLCKDIKNLKWHIVGDGKELENCKKLAKELDAPVIFYGRRSIDEMPEFYSKADAMLVTLKKDFIISMTLPGKVQSYMAAGKPIIGAIDGEAQRVIKEANCGFCADAEDEEGLEKCVRKFVDEQSVEYAKNSYEYYNKNFTKTQFMETLQKILKRNQA